MRNKKAAVFLIVVAITASFAFSATRVFPQDKANQTAKASNSNQQVQPSPAQSNDEIPFMPGVFATSVGDEHLTITERVLNILVRLVLAVILSGILAFRPRHNVGLFQRNLNVAQTQILLSVVAAALMIIVGDNTARAFAIFAAVSLVRFRTNIKDPKEITVLLISLALGLATGVGRWELGIFLCVFVLILLWLLEYKESEQVFRPMELTVKTKNTDGTQEILKKIFAKNKLEAEVRAISPPDENEELGCITYFLNLRLSVSTDYLSEQILNSDTEDIDGIEWKQKKNTAQV